ncbi:hypothetical protein [Stomatohabitans albus]|uniref:hypothetical protein n=1 Tax=Stomatohabitans albus TaxID=3110766 RepID=UPI00300CB578
MNKRLLALISAGVMMFGLAACTGTDSVDATSSESDMASEMSSEKVEAVPYSEKASEEKKKASEEKKKASERKSEASEMKSEIDRAASEAKKEVDKQASEAKSEAKASESDK